MKEKEFKLTLTTWDKEALLSIIDNGQFLGKDIVALNTLINKIKDSKEE